MAPSCDTCGALAAPPARLDNGVPTLEAQACGTPVVAFASGALEEVIVDGETGFLVAPGDIAVGVVIGRASEYFDFFVFGIASVLVFPAVFFPFVERGLGTLYA